jgi:hypothetical protein
MIHENRKLPYLAVLLAAAVIVLQFVAVQHSIEHGGTVPDIGCEFCVSGTTHASLSTHPDAPLPTLSWSEPLPHAPASSTPTARRALPPARGPPILA